jgi:hypothetical protein
VTPRFLCSEVLEILSEENLMLDGSLEECLANRGLLQMTRNLVLLVLRLRSSFWLSVLRHSRAEEVLETIEWRLLGLSEKVN